VLQEQKMLRTVMILGGTLYDTRLGENVPQG